MNTKAQRKLRHRRVRAKVKGTEERPRLSVFRSNRHVWAQLINDASGKTIVAVGDHEGKKAGKKSAKREGGKVASAHVVGEALAKKAFEKKITQAVFDRGGYRYHGIVKAVAEGARKGGLKF